MYTTASFVYKETPPPPSHRTPAKPFVRRRYLNAQTAKNRQVQRFNTGTNRPQTHLPGTTEHFANSSRERKKKTTSGVSSLKTHNHRENPGSQKRNTATKAGETGEIYTPQLPWWIFRELQAGNWSQVRRQVRESGEWG